jgi:hypothetical protein
MIPGSDSPPRCLECRRRMDRVDRVDTEHLVMDDGIYRPLNVTEGLAAEIDLRCGYCSASIPQPVRRYFYERWGELKEVEARLRKGPS